MALVLTILGMSLYLLIRVQLLDQVDRDLQTRGRAMADNFGHRPEGRGGPPPGDGGGPQSGGTRGRQTGPPWFRPRASGTFDRMRPKMFQTNGKVFSYGPPDEKPWDPKALKAAVAGKEILTTIQEEDEDIRVFSSPLRTGSRVNGKVAGVLQIAYSLAETQRNIQAVARQLLLLIPAALIIVGLSAAFLTGRLLKPVRVVTYAAAHINATALSDRLPEVGSDEFTDLARTLNAMLGRLEQSFEQQRRFTADASHELRTPLTAIKAYTSMALTGEKTPAEYRRALLGLDRSATLMGRIVQDLLLLARSDAGQLALELRTVSLSDAVSVAVETVQTSRGASIRVSIDPELHVLGDATNLIRLFTNLLENAERYTPEDGSITVTASIPADSGYMVKVEVRDTGIGIPPEHLPHICERFYRVDASRTRKQGGTGLGLSITRSIVDAHGGELKIESAVGVGTTVTVRLPLAPDDGHVPGSNSAPAPSLSPTPTLHV
jgi:heavy metal sensor kinase